MNSLNLVLSVGQVGSFQKPDSPRELDVVSIASTESSNSVDGAWIAVEANEGVEQENPRVDQESMLRSLMSSVQKLNEKSVCQERKYTELKKSHTELHERFEVLIKQNEMLSAENQALRIEKDEAKVDCERALGVAHVAVQDRNEQAQRVEVLEGENESLRAENGVLQQEVERLLNEANRTNGFFYSACKHLKRSYKNQAEGALKGYVCLAAVGAAGPIVPEVVLVGAGVYGIANIASASIKPMQYAVEALRF